MSDMRNINITHFSDIKNERDLSVPSKRQGNRKTLTTLDYLKEITSESGWSPGVFREGLCLKKNFLYADCVALDFDGGIEHQEVVEKFRDLSLKFVLSFTRSHLKEKAGVISERFRVIVPLANRVIRVEDYSSLVDWLAGIFPQIDRCSREPYRIFLPSSGDTLGYTGIIAGNGNSLNLNMAEIFYSSATDRFLSTAHSGLSGGFNTALNVAAYEQGRRGSSLEDTRAKLETHSQKPFDHKDTKTLLSGWNAGNRITELKHDPETFIKELLERSRFRMSIDGLFTLGDGKTVTKDFLKDLVIREAQKRLKFSYPAYKVEAILNVLITEEREQMLSFFRASMAFAEPRPELFRELCRAATGGKDAVDQAVLQSFIWQVKRKLFEKPVKHHLMPIFKGRSGGGKSTLIEKMIAPFEGLIWRASISDLDDERQRFGLIENYIFFADELAKASRADLGAVKNSITSNITQYRRMRQNEHGKGRNNATFIGASNEDVIDTFKDPTSARRFYQLNCQDCLDWKTINSFDFLGLWRSVDENDSESPLEKNGILPELRKRQELIRFKDSVEQWLADEDLVPREGDQLETKTNDDAYQQYKQYCANSGINHPIQKSGFGRKLSQYLKADSRVQGKLRVRDFKKKDNPYSGAVIAPLNGKTGSTEIKLFRN